MSFFGYEKLEYFLKDYQCICELFIQEKNYFTLEDIQEDVLWINYLTQNPTLAKVLIKDLYGIKYIFKININPLEEDKNKHVVVFTDITASEQEKNILEKMAYQDALTGIYNRQFFDKILQKEKEHMKRYKDELSLLMFDIDHFKKVNDTYGHEIGDKVLVTLTKLIGNNLRENDIFVRWGGEEFIVLLPRTTVAVAFTKAQALRQKIELYKDESIPQITVSIGVTAILEEDTNRACFKRVDDALYQAKQKRNDVVLL